MISGCFSLCPFRVCALDPFNVSMRRLKSVLLVDCFVFASPCGQAMKSEALHDNGTLFGVSRGSLAGLHESSMTKQTTDSYHRRFRTSTCHPNLQNPSLFATSFGIVQNQKNPRAHKNKIGTPPPPPTPPPQKRGILRTWFFLQKERIFSRCP